MSCDICPLCAEIPHRAPDQFRVQNRHFRTPTGVVASQPGHGFLGHDCNRGHAVVTVAADLNSLGSNR